MPALAFTVLRIDHVVLRVRELETAIDFYARVFGCEVVRRRPELGLVHLRAGASMIDLVSVDGELGRRGGTAAATEGRNLDHLCLRIEPFDEAAILTLLREHGLAPSALAQNNFGAEGIGPSIYVNDPDGNLIELKGPAR